MAKPICEHAYRKVGEIIIRCRKQTGEHDFCCYQYHCPDSGRYETRRSGGTAHCAVRGKVNT